MAEVMHGMLRGIGLVADSYVMMGVVLSTTTLRLLGIIDQLLSNALLALFCCGSFLGMILFGLLGKKYSQRSMLLITGMLLSSVAVASSVVAFPVNIPYGAWLLPAFALLGFGVGGDFTLTATATFSTHSSTARALAGAFSMMGLGRLLAPCFMLVLVNLLAPQNVIAVWSIMLSMSSAVCLPAIIARACLLRSSQPEITNSEAVLNAEGGKWLFGTSVSLMLSEVISHCNALLAPTIVCFVGFGSHAGVHDQLLGVAMGYALTAALALPGYYLSVIAIKTLGPKILQLMGFVILAASYTLLGLNLQYFPQAEKLTLCLFCVVIMMSHFGPATTTYVMPALIFDKPLQSSCHGVSAAMGRIGTIISVIALPAMVSATSLGWTVCLCAGTCALGAVITAVALPKTNLVVEAQNSKSYQIQQYALPPEETHVRIYREPVEIPTETTPLV